MDVASQYTTTPNGIALRFVFDSLCGFSNWMRSLYTFKHQILALDVTMSELSIEITTRPLDGAADRHTSSGDSCSCYKTILTTDSGKYVVHVVYMYVHVCTCMYMFVHVHVIISAVPVAAYVYMFIQHSH